MALPMGIEWLRIKKETLNEIESRMPQFLFYQRIDKKRKLCQCSACGNSGMAEVSGKSGETVLCPFCMEPVELKCSSRLSDEAPSLKRWINVIYFINRSGSLWAVGARLERTFCVGGYAARHLTGQTTILFLRRERKPGTPYICIEIQGKDNTIVQIHGYRNEFLGNGRRARKPEDRFRPFLSEWLGWVKAGSKRTGKASRKDETA